MVSETTPESDRTRISSHGTKLVAEVYDLHFDIQAVFLADLCYKFIKLLQIFV